MTRLIRFAGIGGLATLVHVFAASLLGHAAGLPPLAANTAGWLAAVTVSYFGHLHATFGARPDHAQQLPRFMATAAAGLAVSTAVVIGVTAAGGSFALATAGVAITVPLATFVLLQVWVFGPTARGELAAPAPSLHLLVLPLAMGVLYLAVSYGATLHHDVVWYHVATRKWLEGAALYTDIVEVNPPLAFYMTLPVIALADAVGFSDADAQRVVIAALIAASLSLSARHLALPERAGPGVRAALVAGMGALVILLSLRDAGQREHVFLLLALPWLVAQTRGAALTPQTEAGLAALAALGMCLKPFFALLPLSVLILRAAERRSFAPLLGVPGLVFLVTGLAYVGAVALLHPAYLTSILPAARLVYGAYGTEMVYVAGVVGPSAGALFFAGLWTLTRPTPPRGAVVFFTAAAAGFAIYLWQGKGFGYHALPFLTLGGIACLFALADRRARIVVFVALAVVSFEAAKWGRYYNGALLRMAPVIEAESGVESLLVVSSHVYSGPIIAAETGTDWASGYPAQWLVPGAVNALARIDCAAEPGRCATLGVLLERNRADLLADMAKRPDMIVFDRQSGYFDAPFSWEAFLAEVPAFDAIMAEYRLVSDAAPFVYWRRRSE